MTRDFLRHRFSVIFARNVWFIVNIFDFCFTTLLFGLAQDSHVMMVDCWRRLYFYWKSRRNWKSVAWHYTYEWHAHKMKGKHVLCSVYCTLLCFDGWWKCLYIDE